MREQDIYIEFIRKGHALWSVWIEGREESRVE